MKDEGENLLTVGGVRTEGNSPLHGRTVLVTGGTGSFGSAFVDQVVRNHAPRRVIVFSRDEEKQSSMAARLGDAPVEFFVGDIRDRDRVYRAFAAGIDLVVHAAALKQVPSCEYNPFEAVKTNVHGAQNIIDAAIDHKIPRVVAISTDKAVNPANLYGATKLCAEKLFVQGNAYVGANRTRFACVRYGNVVGSRGSVVLEFLRQRAAKKVSITDPRMTRFWIRMEDAISFVIRAAVELEGGEVFVPEIGSMGILDLVEAIVPGAEVTTTGIRAGEKIHEVLISCDEARHTVRSGGMYVILPERRQWAWSNDRWDSCARLRDGFSYSSDTNERKISVSEMREIVARLV